MKQFDEQLFKDNDAIGRHAGMMYSIGVFDRVEHNQDQYGIDLLVDADRAMECEVKRVWKGGRFPWPTIQVPVRKAFMPTDLYFLLSDDGVHFVVLTGWDIHSAPTKVVPNKYVSNGEAFYQVPTQHAVHGKFTMPLGSACCSSPVLTRHAPLKYSCMCGVENTCPDLLTLSSPTY